MRAQDARTSRVNAGVGVLCPRPFLLVSHLLTGQTGQV